MKEGVIKEICISEKKGIRKKPVPFVNIGKDYGILEDAHGGSERQISILSFESVKNFCEKFKINVEAGDFAENLLIEGIDLKEVQIGERFLLSEDVILEVTEIGKECHEQCIIGKTTGKCLMPEEGIFARVLKGGMIFKGDKVRIVSHQ